MIILQISAALGPLECRLAVAKITNILVNDAQNLGIKTEFISMQTEKNEFNGIEIAELLNSNFVKKTEFLPKSLTLSLDAESHILEDFLKTWEGTILWICPSPFRPNHKRKNWFIGIRRLTFPEKITILEKDLKYETMHSSGAGGQHINKTNSAVRLTHLPSGLTVRIESARSQHQNKKLALLLLYNKLEAENLNKELASAKAKNQHHYEIERGNPVRKFEGEWILNKKFNSLK